MPIVFFEGARSPVFSEQANVLCVLYGIADRTQQERILENLYGEEREPDEVKNSPPLPLSPSPPPVVRIGTPYFAFYLLRALYGLGRHGQALDYTREQWGRMLARGATTFWEHYEPFWSLCHAWSAAPTYDLPAEIAGIRPIQPGFEEFSVDLRPADLTWFRTVVPTVRGDIAVGYHSRTEEPRIDAMGSVIPQALSAPALTVNLRVPAGTRAWVRIPVAGIARPTVGVNGATAWEGGQPNAWGGSPFKREGETLTVALSVGGDYHIEIDRSPEPKA